jgi:hypothetical protein
MLCPVRMTASTGRTAASESSDERQQWPAPTRVSDFLCMSHSVHASKLKEHDDNDDFRKRSPRPIDVFSLGRLTLFGVLRLRARQGVPGELISEGVATA